MKLVLLGVGVILVGFGWIVLNASAGYTNAWWWFRWSEFKPIFGAFIFVGVFLIGLGIVKKRKKARSRIIS
ncbi:phage holin family protein [Dethiosulfatarculus sandiegensis]|uniref:Uncharacterized protein n=1 Tax=Dethiosulfatarculus sandiegensis TaxID=1429043 RepID=A0A0D2HRH4_9BACT|nr:phage holin family protein [Dethiosulfatarculus sandiegensis]KIX13173.1 hypothetical protein X474_15725 [Dethiosulfatarculus sandiegensis]